MTKRDQWRVKAARYLRWHRAAMRSPLNDWESSGAWLRMYREARQYAGGVFFGPRMRYPRRAAMSR